MGTASTTTIKLRGSHMSLEYFGSCAEPEGKSKIFTSILIICENHFVHLFRKKI